MQVRRPRPGIEAAFEPEVHRVRAVLDSCRHAQPVARGGQQLQWAIAACSVLRRLEVVIDHELDRQRSLQDGGGSGTAEVDSTVKGADRKMKPNPQSDSASSLRQLEKPGGQLRPGGDVFMLE